MPRIKAVVQSNDLAALRRTNTDMPDTLTNAIHAVLHDGMAVSDAVELFQIQKRTLLSYLPDSEQNRTSPVPDLTAGGENAVFSDEQEASLADFLLEMSRKSGGRLTKKKVKEFVFEFARANGLRRKFNKVIAETVAGKKWMRGFLKRNKQIFKINAEDLDFDSCCVTVFGFPPNCLKDVVERFSQLGQLIHYETEKDANWVYLRFETPTYADLALRKNGAIFKQNMMIGVKESTAFVEDAPTMWGEDPEKSPALVLLSDDDGLAGDTIKNSKTDKTASEDENLQFKCNTCSKIFTRSETLQRHKLCHSRKNFTSGPNCCNYCGKNNKNHHELRTHIKRVHIKPHSCGFCCASFGEKTKLSIHVEKYHSSNSKSFNASPFKKRRALIIKEQLEKSRPENCECRICDKQYDNVESFSKHKQKHSAQLNAHACKFCGEKFKLIIVLKKHVEASHTCPYVCEGCGRRFTHVTRKDVARRCEDCGRRVPRRKTRAETAKVAHGESFLCSVCGECFMQPALLRFHERFVHATKSQSATSRSDKRDEEQVISVNEDIVVSDFKEDLVACEGKESDMDEAMFSCKECGNNFYRKRHLEKHMSLMHSGKAGQSCG